jgi:hypothetical protein
MSLNWRPAPSIPCSVGTSDPFINSLYEFLKYLEANNPITRRYLHVVGSNLTIGIGFDLAAGGPDVIKAVFTQLGLDYDYPENHPNAQPGSPEAIESDYIRRLRVAVQGSNTTAVNNLMLARYRDTRLNALPELQRRESFSFNNDNEVKAVFDNLWTSVYREDIYNRLPSLRNDEAFKTSSEMMALASLVWNGGPGKLTKELRAAIDSGNRAEAWFEIRYNSNKGYVQFRPGIAKRRYFESQMFGLYDNPASVGPTEAQQIYKMLQNHRSEIVAYEKNYGIPVDGTNPLQGNRIAAAKNDFSGLLSYVQSGTVQTIEESLNPAKTALFTYLQRRSDLPDLLKDKLTANIYSTNIYLNPHKSTDTNQFYVLDSLPYQTGKYANGANDLMLGMDQEDIMYGRKGNDILIGEDGTDSLLGEEGNDVLYGGDGDDFLLGGLDNDTMYGGADNDTYFIGPSEDIDTIEDKQGDNTVILCDKVLNFFYKTEDCNTYISPDGSQTLKKSTGEVTDVLFNTTVILKDFEWGDFGITLITLP